MEVNRQVKKQLALSGSLKVNFAILFFEQRMK